MKKYLLYLDILGFYSIPKELEKKTGFRENNIREAFLSGPVSQIIQEIREEIGQEKIIEGTDNYVLIIDDLITVFKLVNKITTIPIPHKDYRYIPLELALDVKDIQDEQTEYKNRCQTINFYKNDIISSYREYYKREHNYESVKQSFLVHTEGFLNELTPSGRSLFSKRIQFNNRTFFLADLEIMQDVDGKLAINRINVEKFKVKLGQARFWKYFEVKSCSKRYYENDTWKVLFLYLKLSHDQPSSVQHGMETTRLKLTHQVRNIDELVDVLHQIFEERALEVGRSNASLEWITGQITFDTYSKSHPHTELFGMVEPTHALTQTGTNPIESADIQRTFQEELQGHAQPYEYLADAVHAALDLHFWSPAYSPFIVVLAPIPITISDIQFTNEQILVHLRCPLETHLDALRIILLELHEEIRQFNREEDSDIVSGSRLLPQNNNITILRLRVLYHGDEIETRLVNRDP